MNQFHGRFIIVKPSFDKTYLTLRFDDGWKSQINAHHLLKKYGMKGSIYISSGLIGKDGYMNWQDVKEISETMEIGGHTMHHVDLRNITKTAALEDEIGDDYRIIKEHGLEPKTFVYPYGNYSPQSLQIVKKYYIGASTQDVGVNTKTSDVYLLKDFTIRSNNTLEDIQRVVKPSTWTILTFHDVGESYPSAPPGVKNNAISVEFFEEILQWLQKSDIKVITMAEGCEMLREIQKQKE